jgi:toxin ParE1/3/4
VQRLKVRFRPEALSDLEEVYQHIYRVSFSPLTAKALVQRLLDRCHRIGDAPCGGRPRDDLEPGLRTVPFEDKAVIAYRVEEDCVGIINVFYGGRDFEALYRGAPPGDE